MQGIKLIPASRVSNIINAAENTHYQFNYLNLLMEQRIKDLAAEADKTIDKKIINILSRQYMIVGKKVRNEPVGSMRFNFFCHLLSDIYKDVQIERNEIT